MISVAISFEDENKGRGLVIAADRGINLFPNLEVETRNFKFLSTKPPIVLSGYAATTQILEDFTRQFYYFLRDEEIKNCMELRTKIPMLLSLYRQMEKFYSQDKSGILAEFIVGMSDEENDAQIYYFNIYHRGGVAIEDISLTTGYVVTAYGMEEGTLLLKEILEEIPSQRQALELSLILFQVFSERKFLVSDKVDVCILGPGAKLTILPDEKLEEEGIRGHLEKRWEALMEILKNGILMPKLLPWSLKYFLKNKI